MYNIKNIYIPLADETNRPPPSKVRRHENPKQPNSSETGNKARDKLSVGAFSKDTTTRRPKINDITVGEGTNLSDDHSCPTNEQGKEPSVTPPNQHRPHPRCPTDGPASNINVPNPTTTAPIVIDNTSPDPKYWIKHNIDNDTNITLYADSKKNILQVNYWLADSEIHAGQQLLKKQYPFIDGLNDPAIQGTLVTPVTSEYIQIVNSGSHWVCLTTVGCPSGTVKLYNSMKCSRPNRCVIDHAARMMFASEKTIEFIIPPVQAQVGINDCGLFALAFATSICHGMLREEMQYSMRRHYVDRLEEFCMKPFPAQQKPHTEAGSSSVYKVKVFCSCRMPNNGKKYIQCSKCQEWYHPTCETIPKSASKKENAWYCMKCQ